MAKPTKTWKAFERIVSRFFQTERNALSRINSKITSSDTLSEVLYIECKYRANSSLHTLYEDTRKKAEKENKLPIVCTKTKGSSGFLITIHSDHFDPTLLLNKPS